MAKKMVKKLIPKAKLPKIETPKYGSLEVYQTAATAGDKGTWRWRLRSRNGKILANAGEAYVRKNEAIKSAERMVAYDMSKVTVVELKAVQPAQPTEPGPVPPAPSVPPAPDTTPPLVLITAPGDGASVGGTIEVKVRAEDANGVKQVELRTDGTSRGFSSTPVDGRYRFMLDTKIYANGQHTLTAIATDNAGNSATSAAVGIHVQNL